MSSAIVAALFDLDGVLLDTEPLYTQATQEVVARFDRTYTFDLKRRIMGGSAKSGAELIVRELSLPITPEEYLAERRKLLSQLFMSTVPIEGAEVLVRALFARGLSLAVATSSERSLFEMKSRNHPWFSLFSRVICGDDPRIVSSKPAPDIFLLAAAELGVRASQCVVFEDSPHGVAAARASGAKVIARRDPALTRDDLALAHVIVTSYSELELEPLLSRASDVAPNAP